MSLAIPSLAGVPATYHMGSNAMAYAELVADMAEAGMIGLTNCSVAQSVGDLIRDSWREWQREALPIISEVLPMILVVQELESDTVPTRSLEIILSTSTQPTRWSVKERVESLNRECRNLGWYALSCLQDALRPFAVVFPVDTYSIAEMTWFEWYQEEEQNDESERMSREFYESIVPMAARHPGEWKPHCHLPASTTKSHRGRVAKACREIERELANSPHAFQEMVDNGHGLYECMSVPIILTWGDDDPTQAVTDDWFEMIWQGGEVQDFISTWRVGTVAEITSVRETLARLMRLLKAGETLLIEMIEVES